MRYAIGIVAHPSRWDQVVTLAPEVEAVVIHVDNAGAGERVSHQDTLEALLKHKVDWYVLLEDDAIPCADFSERLDAALVDAPSPLVSLYLGTGRWAGAKPGHQAVVEQAIAKADAENSTWIVADAMWHAVGVAIREDHAQPLLKSLRRDMTATDRAIGRYAKANKLDVAYTWPSLVDHADGDRIVKSSSPHTDRHAYRLAGM